MDLEEVWTIMKEALINAAGKVCGKTKCGRTLKKDTMVERIGPTGSGREEEILEEICPNQSS